MPHDWGRLGQTFARGLLAAVVAVAPAAYVIARTDGRAATNTETAVALASAAWPAALVIWSEHRKRNRLRASRSSAANAPGAEARRV